MDNTAAGTTTRTQVSPVEEYTKQLYIRARGRSFAMRVESTALGAKWRLGSPRVDLRPGWEALVSGNQVAPPRLPEAPEEYTRSYMQDLIRTLEIFIEQEAQPGGDPRYKFDHNGSSYKRHWT